MKRKNLFYSAMGFALAATLALTATSCRDDDTPTGQTGDPVQPTEEVTKTFSESQLVGIWRKAFSEWSWEELLTYDDETEYFHFNNNGKVIRQYYAPNEVYIYGDGEWEIVNGNTLKINGGTYQGISNQGLFRSDSIVYEIYDVTSNSLTLRETLDNNWGKWVYTKSDDMPEVSIPLTMYQGFWRVDSIVVMSNGEVVRVEEDGEDYYSFAAKQFVSMSKEKNVYKGIEGEITYDKSSFNIVNQNNSVNYTALYINKGESMVFHGNNPEDGTDWVFCLTYVSSETPDYELEVVRDPYTTDDVTGIWKIENGDGNEAYIELNGDGDGTAEGYDEDGNYNYGEFTWTIEDDVITLSNGKKFKVESVEDNTMTLVSEDGKSYTYNKQSGKPAIPVRPELIYGNWQLTNTRNYTDGKITSTAYETEWRVYSSDQFVNIYNQLTDDGSYVGLASTWQLNSDWTITYGSTAFSTQRVVSASSSNLVLRKTTGDNSYQQTEYARVSSVPEFTLGN